MFLKRLPYLLLLFLWIPVSGTAQGHAGPDRTICLSGTTKLGPETPCTSCCYKWSPETGLDDPSKPNPVVSGLEYSVVYAVTVSYPNGNYEEDDVKVTVYEPNIDIYEPEYYAPQTRIPEVNKRIPGAQTFVNIDNDDCDAEFDDNDDLVQGGDNEFVKIRISMRIPPLLPKPGKGKAEEKGTAILVEDKYAAVDLAGGATISGVHLWLSNDKSAGEYQIGDQLLLTDKGEDNYEAFLWAEGTEAHIIQQQVKLTARLFDDVNPVCADNYVSLTVLGVDKMEWIGVENGFTNGDGKNNSNILDHDPNNPDASAVRVFPENKSVAKGAVPKTKVTLKVTFTTTPVAPHPVYLKTFDLDDPITELQFVDPNDGGTDGLNGNYVGIPSGIPQINYTKDNDNRGQAYVISEGVVSGTGSKQGILSEATTGFPDVYERNAVNTKEITMYFWVSQFCGDNYKIAINNDLEFIKNTRNLDKYDQQKIVNACTNGTGNGLCPEIDPSLCSPAITVWRTLHIEYDLMSNPTWNENLSVVGTFSQFYSPTTGYLSDAISLGGIRPNQVFVSQFVNSALPLKDLSKPPGRFQHGGVRIWDSKKDLINVVSAPGTATGQPYIISNGDDIITFNQPVDATFGGTLQAVLKKEGKNDLSLTIKDILKISSVPPTFSVELMNPQPNLSEYENSNVKIGGGSFTQGGPVSILDNSTFEISATSGNQSNLLIPIEIRDDDDIPKDGTSNLINRALLIEAQSIYKEVYIDVVNDGGGDISNNQDNLTFTKNLSPNQTDDIYAGPNVTDNYTTDDIFKSSKSLNDSYWGCQIVGAWQKLTNLDNDPGTKDDGGTRATTYGSLSDCTLSTGSSTSFIYYEAVRESEGIKCASISLTIPHELGHCFGLTHGDGSGETGTGVIATCLNIPSLSDMGIMTAGKLHNCQTSKFFIPYHQNIIRIRTKSPGK